MGGLGSHHSHPYVVQTLAFLASMLLPGAALALVAGAYWERFRRRRHVHLPAEQGTVRVALLAELSRD